MKKFSSRYSFLLLSLLAGLLLAASWPARGFPFLAFIAFIPLLWVEEELFERRNSSRSLLFFLHAWGTFLVFNLLTTWWILHATVPGMIAAVLLNSLFMAVPFWLMHLGRRIVPAVKGAVPLVVFWLTFEHLHTKWELSWSWLDMGNVFAAYPAWVQWYELTGVAGGSLWVLLVNILLFSALRRLYLAGSMTKRVKWNAVLALMLFIVPATASLYIWYGYQEEHDPVNIVIVQPSEDPYEEVTGQAQISQRLSKIVSLADESVTGNTKFFIAPEGASPRGIWTHEHEIHYTVHRLWDHLSNHPQAAWIIGSFTYQMYKDYGEATRSARPFGDTGQYYDVFNSAVMVEHNKDPQYYNKTKLVPGIERMPYFHLLRPVGRLVDRFGGIAGSLGARSDTRVFESSEGIKVAPAVCYESVYGEFLAGHIRERPGLLVVITNDGWWKETPGHRQHVQYARLRAIESRRSIARSASTGISAFIDQKGRIIKQSSWWETTSMSADLNQNHKLTFFTRSGNYLGKTATFLSFLLILNMVSQRLIRRRQLTGKTN